MPSTSGLSLLRACLFLRRKYCSSVSLVYKQVVLDKLTLRLGLLAAIDLGRFRRDLFVFNLLI